MDAKLVCVVIPAYNAASYLQQAIDSVLVQTFRDFEIIVVDDGSTDMTRQVVQKYGEPVRYIYQDNRGLAAARNTGIRNSLTEIIALLDADDLWEPKFLEAMINLLAQYHEAAGAYCGFQYIDSQGRLVGKPSLKVFPPEKFHEVLISNGNWLSACGVVFRKRMAEAVGLFDESLRAVEDEDLWIRMSAHWHFVGLPEALVKYRRHDNNMSNDPERMVTALLQTREKIFGPASGDVKSWPTSKILAYRNSYQFAAMRYFGFGDLLKSADFIQRLGDLSWNFVCTISFWRGLIRAHLPEVDKFEPHIQLDWKLTGARICELLEVLARRLSNSETLQGQYYRVKGCAYLAMADEVGRGGLLHRALVWLIRAAFVNPRIVISRPYWGTVARSLFFISSQPSL